MTTNTVTLNAAEIRIVRWIGQQRLAANRAAGFTNLKVGPESEIDTETLGFAGELAFAKLFNVYPDFVIGARVGSADCERFGESIDVKTTKYPNGKLIAQLRKREFAADVYALMIVEWPTFRFVGFARGDDLLTPARVADLGHGDVYAIEQDELTADQIRWS